MKLRRTSVRVAIALVVLASLSVGTATASEARPSRTPVMQANRLTAAQMADWFNVHTRSAYRATVPVGQLTQHYVTEGRAEGLAGDIAFAQAVLETAWFSYPSSGQVRPSYNNFGGMGACDSGTCTVARFPTAQIGVRAQIQHLRAYADPTVTSTNLANPLVSPRFHLVNPKGRAPTWEQFGNGTWATDPVYADKVLNLYASMLRYTNARTGGSTGSFVDVRPGNTHFTAIESMRRNGVTLGCTDYAYCPSRTTTRAQMASLLVRAQGLPLSDQNRFSDVSGTHRRAINALAAAGITEGCAPGRFCPNDPVTRGQMASFLQRSLGLPGANHTFKDAQNTTHRRAIGAIAKAGITKGYDDGTFRPHEPINRAQMGSFIHRAFLR